MPKEIVYGSDAREKIKAGVDKVADAVKVTLGPQGRNVLIGGRNMQTIVTKDGVTVARMISVMDDLEEIGADSIRQVALKTLADAGDGTTTSVVLSQALYDAGMKAIAEGANPIELKKGIDIATAEVVGQIKEMAVEVTEDMLTHVATISANGEEEIGKLVAEAFVKVGKDGVVNVMESGTSQTRIEMIGGMQIQRGFVSYHAINNLAKMNCEMENCSIFLTDKSISKSDELFKILDAAGVNKHQNLLIICKDVEAEALAAYNANRERIQMPVCIVQAPEWGEHQKEILKDIAAFTGAAVFGDAYGRDVKSITATDFGKAGKITCNKSETVIMAGMGEKQEIEKRVMKLRTLANDAKDNDKYVLESRIAKLNGSIAVIYVGGSSQIEINEKKDRYDDSIRATKAALEEGVVPGGGTCLIKCSPLAEGEYSEGVYTGINLIASVLESPFAQIISNAGIELEGALDFHDAENLFYGYDARKEQMCDLMAAGVLDPAKVVRVALENSTSIVGTMLTSECVMVEVPVQMPDHMRR